MNMDEWELSKENVQPLKSGRKVANLTAALQLQTQPNNVDRQQIILQRQALEADLRSYAGDDPIVPWENYIQWTEQTFPKGGNRKESNLRLLLERCVQQFKDDPRYKNDPRYVSAWIKLAINFSTDPFEMFQFMRDQGIGFQVADFYEAWAWQLEQVGNTKKADTVYQEGINCKAVPLDRLQSRHREFQFRVARMTMQQLQDSEMETAESSSGPQRTALGGLKGKGKHHKVGTQRTGAASKKGGPGIFGVETSNNQLGQQFSVFDENSDPSVSSRGATSLPAPTGEWENMPTRDQAYKENEQSAGPWTGQRVRQSRIGSAVGLDEVSSFRKPSFSVHVDDAPQPITTPHKLPEMGNQVLSARKPEKQPDNPLKNIQKAISGTSDDGKTKVMYCKHLIYGGATEMSFEEIRAIKMKAKKEEARLRAEREALIKRQAEIEEQHQLMMQKQMDFERKMQERMEQQQMRHEEELKRFQEQYMRQQELKKMASMQPAMQQENRPAIPGLRNTTQNAMLSMRPPSIDQENQPMSCAPASTHNAVLSRQAPSIDQENQPMNFATTSTQNAELSAQAQSFDQENQAMSCSAPSIVSQTQSRSHDMPVSQSQQRQMPLGAPTPEQKHSMTVDRAKQQLLELRQQTQSHRLNESVYCSEQDKDQYGDGQQSHEQHENPANLSISCTKQLQFDETRTVNMDHLQALVKTNQPTPCFGKPPPLPNMSNVITPNASAIFNTSSNNTSQTKTPLNRSQCLDSRASSHSGRLSRITPSHTPGGITAPSPTVNTKEAFGVIMAMLNNPLQLDADEGWRPAAADGNGSSIMGNDKHDFESEFAAKEDPQPPKKCAFTIAVDEDAYAHLDNQENNPPKDFVAPGPDTRPRSGILQPSVGIPVEPLDADDKENVQLETDQGEEMEGIEPIKPDETDHILRNSTQHEATMMHHSTHTAFEAAARMASTPFNPQSALERPSFSMTPMSSIKAPMDGSLHGPQPASTTIPAPMNGSLHRPVPTSTPFPTHLNGSLHRPVPSSAIIPQPGSQHRSAPFSIAVDPVPTSVSCGPPAAEMQEPVVSHESTSNIVGATRVEVSGLESFDVNETTINPPRQLSPIMETSNEDNPSSASSSNGSRQSQTHVALTASHIQSHSTIDKENQSLHTSKYSTTSMQSDIGKGNCSSVTGASDNALQMSSFVSVRKSTSSSQGSESKYDIGSEFHITDDVFTSTKLHQSKLDITASTLKENDGDGMLANDMSSLVINDQSVHHRMTHDGDVSMAPQMDQNQSWLNQSSRLLNSSTHHKSLHESRLEQSAAPNVNIHQQQLDGSTVSQSQRQNESVANASIQRQNESVMNASVHRQNESFMTASVHQQLDCSVMSQSQRQNESLMNMSTRPGGEQVAVEAGVGGQTNGINPWDEDLKQSLLASTVPSISSYPGYSYSDNCVPDIKPHLAVSLGEEVYTIANKIGEGAFAKVYSAGILNADDFELEAEGDGSEVAIKVESPPCAWEFYISQQLQVRTKELDGIDVSKSLMDVKNAYMFNDASCLVTALHSSGTLLDAINLYGGKGLPEDIALYFTIELMRTIEKIHAAGIIHGDIKPDNIMLTNLDDGGAPAVYEGHTKYLKLIDMGRGIDMRLLPRGTVFKGKSGTSGCDCVEMKTGRPWTYQTDLYGLAVTIVCMVCGTYMKTFEEGGRWKTTANFKRWGKVNWKEIVESLINIPSCDELPSLSDMCQSLEDTFRTSIDEDAFNSCMERLAIQL